MHQLPFSFSGLLALLMWVALPCVPPFAMAEDFVGNSRFFRQLVAPMNSVLDGKPFRGGLESIATQAGLNLWLDRQVDPSAEISTGSVGPTVFLAIEKLAASRGCEVMAVGNVVLVGRPVWVDHTSAAVLSIPKSSLGDPVDIAWPELTTAQQALKLIMGNNQSDLPVLPHDLWPAVKWHQIERQVAMRLVLSQFEPAPEGSNLTALREFPYTRRYSTGMASITEIRSVMTQADASAVARVVSGWIVTRGNISAHRALTRWLLTESVDVSGPDPDSDTFTLNRMTTSAENALTQLAQTAGKQCVIEPDAVEACKQVISIEGREMSLRQLINLVAKQVGVTAIWQDDKIVIAMPR